MAEDQPSWAEIVRHAGHGESVSVIAHGDHVADIAPSGELDRLRKTIEVLSGTGLVRELREGAWPMPVQAAWSPPNRSPLTWPPAALRSGRNPMLRDLLRACCSSSPGPAPPAGGDCHL
jgi:hypothetical protein